MVQKVIFSIIICTYNGALRIQDTLQHIAELDSKEFEVEALLIDNNSSDEVREVATEYWNQIGAPFSFIVYKERKAGKSYALARGIQESSGDFIIICDDDNWLQMDYLKIAVSKFKANPKLGIAGGVSLPVSDIPIPDWFNKYGYYYACGKRSETLHDFTGGKFLWGAGMIIPRAIAMKISSTRNPQILSCRKNDELISGGDDELCLRTWLLGYRTVFFPDLVLQHFIADYRLNMDYCNRLITGFNVQSETINAYKILYAIYVSGWSSTLFLKKFTHYIWCTLLRDFETRKIVQNYLFFLSKGKFFKNKINMDILNWYRANTES